MAKNTIAKFVKITYNTEKTSHMKQTHFRRLAAATALCSLLFQSSAVQAASSWSPTLLVNTESFQTIDVGDGTTNIELRFGSTGNNRFFYDECDYFSAWQEFCIKPHRLQQGFCIQDE